MISNWNVSEDFLEKIRKIVDENKDSNIARERRDKNIKREGIELTRDSVWKIIVGCHVTSNQKSGENSPSEKLIQSGKSFLLNYKKCLHKNAEDLTGELKKNQIRYNKQIAEELLDNLHTLESGGWDELIQHLESIKERHTRQDEKNVIVYLLGKGRLKGIGPKQSRNLLQWLGLSVYEIPIDSRGCKILKDCGCNFVPSAGGLQDETVYEYMEQGLQLVSEKLGIKPCILDACLFNSLEKDK